MQPTWTNYSKLGVNKYHCHLSYSCVACWWSGKEVILNNVTFGDGTFGYYETLRKGGAGISRGVRGAYA